jgi:phage gp45-like
MVHTLQTGRATTAASDGGLIRTIQLTFMTLGNVISSISQMQFYGFASRPHANSDHAVIALGNNPSMSISIASNDQRFQVSLVEGEVAIHDDLGQIVHLTRSGITVKDQFSNTFVTSTNGIVQTDKSGSTMTMADNTITLAPKNLVVSVTGEVVTSGNAGNGGSFVGNLAVTGSIAAPGTITAGGDITAGTVSVLNHVHSDAGGAGNSGPPVTGT